ncbi:hypothetical protein Esti_001934 [Eimeria stiedai]
MAHTPGVCTICFAPLKGTLTTYATCGHKYHQDCYCTWICSNKGSELLCSQCRGPVCQSRDEWVEYALQKLPKDDEIDQTGKNPSLQERLMATPRPDVQQQEATWLKEQLPWINQKLKADAMRPKSEYEKKFLTLRAVVERPAGAEVDIFTRSSQVPISLLSNLAHFFPFYTLSSKTTGRQIPTKQRFPREANNREATRAATARRRAEEKEARANAEEEEAEEPQSLFGGFAFRK